MNTSLRAFARLLNVSHTAVHKAVTRGRLWKSVGFTDAGIPKIVDVALARREWTQRAARPTKSQTSERLVDAQERVAFERARGLQLANDKKQKGLIPAAAAQREACESMRIVREAVLSLPSKLAAELAAETDQGKLYLRLDTELRQTLEAAADKLMAAS